MVQKTTEKLTDKRLFSSRNATTSEKHFPSFSMNRMSLREIPIESGIKPQEKDVPSNSEEAQNNSDSAQLVGTKRQQAECSSSPASRLQSLATNGATGHLVYVRRKLETEHGKPNAASDSDTASSSGLRKHNDEVPVKPEPQDEQTAKVEDNSSKPAAVEVPNHRETQNEISNFWTERFNRLQDHLQYLDKLGLKDYAEKFRNFSVDDLNRHAVELEKRAIRLSLEEAMQSKCVKDLNLLGKS